MWLGGSSLSHPSDNLDPFALAESPGAAMSALAPQQILARFRALHSHKTPRPG